MKVLQVCLKYYPAIGGVEQHVRNCVGGYYAPHQRTWDDIAKQYETILARLLQ